MIEIRIDEQTLYYKTDEWFERAEAVLRASPYAFKVWFDGGPRQTVIEIDMPATDPLFAQLKLEEAEVE